MEKGVSSGEELLKLLERIEGQLQAPQARCLRLIIIDSVANVFRYATRTHPFRFVY